jgi:hypothetical protein
VRERLSDDVHHADATMYKREMVIAHVSQADVARTAGDEEAPVADCGGVDRARSAETRLSADESIEEPGGVGEVGAHAWARGAEEVDKDEVLDC